MKESLTVLIGVVFVSNCNPTQCGALLTKDRNNRAGIHSSDSRNTLLYTPFPETLYRCPMGVSPRYICDDHTYWLYIFRLEMLQ